MRRHLYKDINSGMLYEFSIPSHTDHCYLTAVGLLKIYFEHTHREHRHREIVYEMINKFDFLKETAIHLSQIEKNWDYNKRDVLHGHILKFIKQNEVTDLNEIKGPLLTLFKLQVLV